MKHITYPEEKVEEENDPLEQPHDEQQQLSRSRLNNNLQWTERTT